MNQLENKLSELEAWTMKLSNDRAGMNKAINIWPKLKAIADEIKQDQELRQKYMPKIVKMAEKLAEILESPTVSSKAGHLNQGKSC